MLKHENEMSCMPEEDQSTLNPCSDKLAVVIHTLVTTAVATLLGNPWTSERSRYCANCVE